jgi:hypothetical protein
LGDRLGVGRQVLALVAGVRILLPQPAHAARPHRLEAQDTALSRLKHGFESRWGHHLNVAHLPLAGFRPSRFAREYTSRVSSRIRRCAEQFCDLGAPGARHPHRQNPSRGVRGAIESRTRPCQRGHPFANAVRRMPRITRARDARAQRHRTDVSIFGHWRGHDSWVSKARVRPIHPPDRPEIDWRRAGYEAAVRPRDHRADGSTDGSGPRRGPRRPLGL